MTETRRKSKLKKEFEQKRRRILLRASFALIAAGGAAAFSLHTFFQPLTMERRVVTLTIPSKASAAEAGEVLQKDGVIRSAFAFRAWAKWNGEGSKFKAGRYGLSSNMTLAQIVQQLDAGPNQEGLRVTIPEGRTVKQIADLLQQKGIIDADEFLRAATDAAAIAKLRAAFPLPKDTLEGYLFPDTYQFEPHTAAPAILEAMLLNFSGRFVRPYQHVIEASGQDLNALVTLASLIESEARVPADRPRIAGVLENRLQKGMKLEVDTTVEYALGEHRNRLYYKDLKVESPYNTYRVKGLPPGAIANPGLPSLMAALHPEKNDYFYYVARPNGSHIFTRTLAEHEAAKRQARSERRGQENNGG